MKKKHLLISSFAAVIIISTVFTGCKGFHGRGMFGNKSISDKLDFLTSKLSKELELNDQQQKELDKIKSEIQVKLKNRHSEMLKEIISQIKSENIDEEKTYSLVKGKIQQKGEMIKYAISKTADFQRILNKEQKNKLAVYITEMHSKMFDD